MKPPGWESAIPGAAGGFGYDRSWIIFFLAISVQHFQNPSQKKQMLRTVVFKALFDHRWENASSDPVAGNSGQDRTI
jgi:hypothetical protein